MKFGPMMDDSFAIYHGNVTGRKAELLSGWGSIASPAMLLIRYTVHKHFDARGNSYTFGQQTMDYPRFLSTIFTTFSRLPAQSIFSRFGSLIEIIKQLMDHKNISRSVRMYLEFKLSRKM